MRDSEIPKVLKSTVGIDSVHLQIEGINKKDVDRFCGRWKLPYGENKKSKHMREWKLFLAGGQPISAQYHFSSRTTTFQIGRLMNYSTTISDSQKLLQQLVHDFHDRKISVSSIDISVDINEPILRLSISSNVDEVSTNMVGTTHYHNRKNGSVLCMYDKAVQMQIYSTPLTRIELRMKAQLRNWKVKDLLNSKKSLNKLAMKVKHEFEENIDVSFLDGKYPLQLDVQEIDNVLEDFVAFVHGDISLNFKDHFRIAIAIAARDRFKVWMKRHRIKSVHEIKQFVKGNKAIYLQELALDHKTFNKALHFFEGIPNFKIT